MTPPGTLLLSSVPCFLLAMVLASSPAPGADAVISEFLAVNTTGLTDEDGDDSDWIEISNISGNALDLTGWHLTDDNESLDQWTFPAFTLAAGQKAIVFASGKNRASADTEMHTNFKLSSSGEYLALVRPDGVTVESAFAPAYPNQYPDISYGAGDLDGTGVQLVGPGNDLRFWVPTGGSRDVGGPNPFNDTDFDDSAWTQAALGVGYSTRGPDPFDDFIGTGGNLRDTLFQRGTSVYLRVPFIIEDPRELTSLTLRARYDDGFVAYINGSPVLVSANPPTDGVLDFQAAAGTEQDAIAATALEPFPIELSRVNLLPGANTLAIHAMSAGISANNMLFDCELDAQVTPASSRADLVYMTSPTPGLKNSAGVPDLGPVIGRVTENPERPDITIQNELLITAEVSSFRAPISTVTLIHRRGFGTENPLRMRDDGRPPDLAADDGVFSASLPLAGLGPGGMVRWRVEATDTNSSTSGKPFFGDPLNSPRYYGTAALDPAINSRLPVLEWFIQNPDAANNRTGTRAACLFLGEFYDNIYCRIRGGSSAGLAKKSYKFDFNTGHHFRFSPDPDAVRAEEFNLNTTWTDKAYIRQPLSYEFYDRAGSPGPVCFLTRVQQNGEFFSVAAYTEQVDRRLLRREERLDDDGALYKMFNGGTSSTSGVEKKNRRHEDNADLAAFLSGINSSRAAREKFIFDHVDLPRQLNYLAATVLTQNNDNMRKNYYLYRDSEGSGEWTQLPWDVDLTWGSHYMTGDNISHDGIWATEDYVLGGRNSNAPISPSHPFVGIQELPGNRSWNRIIDRLLENPRFKAMFQRRLRTLVDELLLSSQPNDSIAAYTDALGRDAALDVNKWGQFGQPQSLGRATAILQREYINPRRNHLSVTHLASNAASYTRPPGAPSAVTSARLPDAQVARPQISFGTFEARPASGDQDEEYIELQNANAFAVDISNWRLAGGVTFTFLPGTIIEANRSLYVSPRVSTFRTRPTSPRGDEGLNVEGGYEGQLSARGETIELLDESSIVVDTLTTPGAPSPQQTSLRITELHYAPPGGRPFEFIELRNIGISPLDLTGVTFTRGISFTFTSGNLAPGEHGLLVTEPANFPGLNILGVYSGSLNNGGEQVTMRDATGENILSFEFSGNWFSPARGGGYSIDILDENAEWSSWDLIASWGLSSGISGSPGVANPVPRSNTYRGWSARFFTPAQLDDDSISAPGADASGDGTPNLIKYALGLDPTVRTTAGLPVISSKGGFLDMSFRRLAKTADLILEAEISTDLNTWSVLTTQATTVDNGDGTENVILRSNTPVFSDPRQFIRLRVTQQ